MAINISLKGRHLLVQTCYCTVILQPIFLQSTCSPGWFPCLLYTYNYLFIFLHIHYTKEIFKVSCHHWIISVSCRKKKVTMQTSPPLPPWPVTGFLLRSTCSIMAVATLKQATTGCSYGMHTRKTPRASWMNMCSVSWKPPAVNLQARAATLQSPAPQTGCRRARFPGL